MKTIKNLLSIILSLALVSGGVMAAAEEIQTPEVEPIEQEYVHASAISSGILIDQNGKSTCSGTVNSRYTTDTINLTIQLQKYTNGSWSIVKSWSGSGVFHVTVTKNYYVTSGYDYRVVTIASLYTSSGSFVERIVQASATKHY